MEKEKEREKKTRATGLLYRKQVWRGKMIGWSGVRVQASALKGWRDEGPKTGKQRGRGNRVNGKQVFVIMNVDIFIQLKRATFRMNF